MWQTLSDMDVPVLYESIACQWEKVDVALEMDVSLLGMQRAALPHPSGSFQLRTRPEQQVKQLCMQAKSP